MVEKGNPLGREKEQYTITIFQNSKFVEKRVKKQNTTKAHHE